MFSVPIDSRRVQFETTLIDEAYPPCYKAASDLELILIRELRLETHHRGRVLVVTTFCDPVHVLSLHSGVRDVEGGLGRLTIHSFPATLALENILPKDACVAVKEPYYKVHTDGTVEIRVDHPSDLLVLNPYNDTPQCSWQHENIFLTGLGKVLFEGVVAMRESDRPTLVDFYTKALMAGGMIEDEWRQHHYTRAKRHLQLGQYEDLCDDAIAAVTQIDESSKEANLCKQTILSCAAGAHYKLGNFLEAKNLYDRALDLNKEDKEVADCLLHTKTRLVEQEEGVYDFSAMSRSATSTHHHLDHASFLSNTRIASACDRGRGLFATKDIGHGDIIMVEKAFHAVFKDEVSTVLSFVSDVNTNFAGFGGMHIQVWRRLINTVQANPNKASKYLQLYDGGGFKTKEVKIVDGSVVVDAFQVQAIAQFNSFHCPNVKSSLVDEKSPSESRIDPGFSSGVWLHASYINHACIGNATRACMGDMMILRATKDIQAGEEILHSYCIRTDNFLQRKHKLAFYKFECDCALCRVESQVPVLLLKRREQLALAAERLIVANQRPTTDASRPVPAATLNDAKSLLTLLDATYNKSLYGDLPRLSCVALDLWFCEAEDSVGRGIVTTTRLLRDLGFKLSVKKSQLTIDRANGVSMDQVVHGAMYGSQAWAAAGERGVAASLLEFAKEMYRVMNGEMDRFTERFGPGFDE